MNTRISHLLWLGAGTASEPTNLLNTAEQVTLIEARETACDLLRNQYAETNINIKQQLVDAVSEHIRFTEYNLAEYSAITPATGLKALFPGLRKTGEEQLTSIAINNVIADLRLSGTNNSLIIDIPDLNLTLLQALQQHDQISLFKNIYVHTALDPLYEGSSTRADIIAFMQSAGYELLQENNQDPELPWLTFFVNPLWLTLQKAKQELASQQQAKDNLTKELEKSKQELDVQQQAKDNIVKEWEKTKQELVAQQHAKDNIVKELEKTKQELVTQQQDKNNLTKEWEKTKTELITQQQAKDNLAKELEKSKQEFATQKLANDGYTKELENSKKTEQDQAKEINKLRADLEKISKHAGTRADKISQLEKENRLLNENSEQLQKRQKVLQQELLKAEAQIDIIKDLLLKH